ncbi:MAG: hypothetical protein IT306_29245 [Chloroflexi bacterium]|nr:hypothetical protein [Chloroflexota bacterium]
MPRGRYYDVIFYKDSTSGAFKPAANPSVTVYENGTTTPLAATIYAAPTGGTTLSNPLTGDANGVVEFYLEDPQDVSLLVTATGLGSVTKPAVPVISSAKDLEASSATISLSGTRTLLAKHADESTYGGLWYGKQAGNRFMLSLNNQSDNATVTENTSFLVTQTQATHYVTALFGIEVSAGGADSGALRATAAQRVAGSSNYRAGEFHTFRYAPASAGDTWGLQIGVHTEVTGANLLHNVGIYLTSDGIIGTPITAVRADTGILVAGNPGWKHAIRYLDTDGSTLLFNVDQSGHTTAGNVVPRTASTYSLGAAGNRWLAAYLDNLLMTAGSASAPTVASRVSTTDGLYWPGAGQVALTVGATDRAILSSSGLTLDDPIILPQIATPSAPGTALTSVYSKTGGGLYSRANGGSEKQHKAGGQFGFASGTTNSPTTTSISYSDLAEMSVTMTTTGGDLLCWFASAFAHSDATKAIQIAFSLDGAAEVGAFSLNEAVANKTFLGVGLWRFTGVSAGSHTVKIRWLTDGATATANGTQRQILVLETPS